jgi:hypothetical protein
MPNARPPVVTTLNVIEPEDWRLTGSEAGSYDTGSITSRRHHDFEKKLGFAFVGGVGHISNLIAEPRKTR